MENSVKTFTDHFDEFADNATTTLKDSAKSRDYFDGAQLTPEEYGALLKRKQPPIVRNMIQRAILKVLGAETQLRSDPKAYPRTPADEDGAEAITKGLRFVADNIDLDEQSSEQFEFQIVEGFGGGIVEVDPKTLEVELTIINPDRLYWDVHSRKNDFKDSKYFGIVAWMDVEDIKRKWPDKSGNIQEHMQNNARRSEFDDKPDNLRWVNFKRNRMMVNQEYYLKDDEWHEVFFCQACILSQKKSPYLDDRGEPTNPIEIESSFVSRQGDRYGLVEAMKDPQDEVNKRGSKALHILNVNQTMGERGAVENINTMKAEKAKPDGHIELAPGALVEGRFQVVDQTSELVAHLQMMQEAKSEIDDLSIDASLSASASGRSRELEQQDQLVKIGRVFDRHRSWKKRIYRQIWCRMKQFWDEEKWIRVTDEEDAAEFVGLNQPVTLGELVQAHAEQTGEEIPQEMLQDPRMSQVVQVRNNVKELDMDIILDEAPNYINLQHEIFAAVMEGAKTSGQPIPLDIMLDLMPSVPNKRQILDKLKGDEQAQEQQQQVAEKEGQIQDLMAQLEVAQREQDIAKTTAETGKIEAETVDEYASATQKQAQVAASGFA